VGAIAVAVVLIAAACDFNGTAVATTVPAPGGASPALDLTAVSCVPSGDCVAAGTIAALRSGSTWAELTSPPASITALSCVSITDCIGIHDFGPSDSAVYHYDGSTWSTTNWPSATVPRRVSCAASTMCMVVSYTNPEVVEMWNGATFTDAGAPLGGFYKDISCPTATFCLMVGQGTSAAKWTGGASWSLVPTSGLTGAGLTDVSCATPTLCETTDSSDFQIGTWDGSTLVGGPSDGFQDFVVGYTLVSCPTPTASQCQLASYDWDDDGTTEFIESFLGNGVAGTGGLDFVGGLQDLSCSSGTNCVALGQDSLGGRAAWHFDGSKWTADTFSIPYYADTRSSSLSCPSSSFCMMGGTYAYGSNGRPYVRRWNGSTWTTTPLFPAGSGGDATAIDVQVGCLSSTDCVGLVRRYSGEVDVDTWDGTTWTQQNATYGSWVVSCSGPSFCLMVSSNAYMVWNGSTLTNTTHFLSGNPPAAISCGSPTRCVVVVGAWLPAVGHFQVQSQLAEWDGTTLSTPIDPPAPAGEMVTIMGVSCPASGPCRGVGAYGPVNTDDATPYVIEGDANSWSSVSLPASGPGVLTSVSCPGGGECLAVGSGTVNGSNDSELLLAETGAGKWYLAPDLPESGSTPVAYDHISCVPTWCAAVGEYSANGHPTVTSAIYTWKDGS
jgi:hypothetical protein